MLIDEGKKTRVVYVTLLIISLTWLGSIFAAPLLIATGHFTASTIIYQSFSVVCHQMADRSFHILGFPLGVCSRCSAIYTGFVAGLMCYPFVRDISQETLPGRTWLIVSSIPMLIDLIGGFTGLYPSTFFSRSATGLIFGLTTAFYILPGFVSLSMHKEQNKETVYE